MAGIWPRRPSARGSWVRGVCAWRGYSHALIAFGMSHTMVGKGRQRRRKQWYQDQNGERRERCEREVEARAEHTIDEEVGEGEGGVEELGEDHNVGEEREADRQPKVAVTGPWATGIAITPPSEGNWSELREELRKGAQLGGRWVGRGAQGWRSAGRARYRCR